MKAVPIWRNNNGSREMHPWIVAFVDDEDYDRVMQHKWHLDARGGVQRSIPPSLGGRHTQGMHRFILGFDAAQGVPHVDHIDGFPLNNCKSNLRECTPAENNQNRRRGYGTSTHRGVAKTPDGQWQAYARVKERMHYLGRYTTEAEASAAARDFRAKNMPFSAEALEHVPSTSRPPEEIIAELQGTVEGAWKRYKEYADARARIKVLRSELRRGGNSFPVELPPSRI